MLYMKYNKERRKPKMMTKEQQKRVSEIIDRYHRAIKKDGDLEWCQAHAELIMKDIPYLLKELIALHTKLNLLITAINSERDICIGCHKQKSKPFPLRCKPCIKEI